MKKQTKAQIKAQVQAKDQKIWTFNDKLLVFNYKSDDLTFEVDVEELSLNEHLKAFRKTKTLSEDALIELEKLWTEKIGTRDKMSMLNYLKSKKPTK
jgi:hypothetical protein